MQLALAPRLGLSIIGDRAHDFCSPMSQRTLRSQEEIFDHKLLFDC